MKGKKTASEVYRSVDYLESNTDINFFPELSDSIESLMESTIDVSRWW
jgi:hypothetical protein